MLRVRSIVRISGLLAAVVLLLLAFATANARAQSGSLTTLFNADNSNAGNTFDLEVKDPAGVTIESFDVNVNNAGATPEVEVLTRPGTAVGSEATTDGWTSQGTASVTSAGQDVPTSVPISFSLPSGAYGVAIGVNTLASVNWLFTNTNGGPDTFEDPVLKLVSGLGLNAPLLTGGAAGGRIWNGTIYYSVGSAECKALDAALAAANSELSAANDAASAANDDVSAAKKKKKKAKKRVKKAKKNLKQAKQSGNANKIKKAKKKLKKAKKKLKKAKKKLKKAKAATTEAEADASQAQAAASQAQAALDQACK